MEKPTRAINIRQLSAPYQVTVDISNVELEPFFPDGLPPADQPLSMPSDFYHDLVKQVALDELKQTIILTNVLQVGRLQDTVRVVGNVWIEPVLSWPMDAFNKLLDLFMTDNFMPPEMLDALVERKKARLRFDRRRIKIVTNTDPVVVDEFVEVLASSRMGKQVNSLQKHVWGMSVEKCPESILNNTLGKKVGDKFEFVDETTKPDPTEWTAEITGKILAPELTDEEFCQMEDCPSIEAYRNSVKRMKIKEREVNTLQSILNLARVHAVFGPIPHEFIFDWANGNYSSLLMKKKESAFLKEMGVESKQDALGVLSTAIIDEFMVSLVAKQICEHYKIMPTEEELKAHAIKNSGVFTEQTRYLATLDFCKKRAEKYFQTQGKETDFNKRLMHIV